MRRKKKDPRAAMRQQAASWVDDAVGKLLENIGQRWPVDDYSPTHQQLLVEELEKIQAQMRRRSNTGKERTHS